MAVKWTEAQRAAIETRGKSLLVSAAAGSGKTAVLTARIISKLIRGECELSDLCVVTFTRAAAAELKERVQKALSEALEADEGNQRLTRQLLSLPSARISTIHSFCFDVLRTGFQSLGLSSGVRIADEAEISLLKTDAMNDAIDAFYSDPAYPDFGKFADIFITDRDDRLADLFISVGDSLNNLPEGFDYLGRTSGLMRECAAGEKDFMLSPWGGAIRASVMPALEHYRTIYLAAAEYFREDELFREKYLPVFEDERGHLESLENLLTDGGYSEIAEALRSFPKSRLSPLKSDQKTEQSEYFCSARTDFSSDRRKITENYFGWTEQEARGLAGQTSEVSEKLRRVLADYRDRLNAQKRRRKLVDYSDLERMTAALLYDSDGKPSDTAKELRGRFEEICIDEYQDVNALQDRIFAAFARPGGKFMVGDVKQSIYRFRGAEPDIFAAYRDSYASGGDPRSEAIFLSDNFRCDKTIVDFANAVSGCLFTHNSGKVPYYQQDALICSKTPEGAVSPVTIALFDRSDDDKNRSEAAYVASQVASLINSGVPAGDIALLFRSAKSSAGVFCEELARSGIKAHNSVNGDFFEIPEIQLVMCLLNAVDNPARDIYLAGALRSPVFGFTLGELAIIRQSSDDPRETLYDSLKKYYSDENRGENDAIYQKCGFFFSELTDLRENARSQPVDRFIRYLYRRLNLTSTEPGAKRNLTLLYEYARKFEGGSFKGLYNFILYINDILEKRKTVQSPPETSENEAGVGVMTVHQSKGLEFPYVFICDAGRAFNRSESRENMLLGRGDLGLTVKLRDKTGYARLDTPLRSACAASSETDSTDEEMRVLYVAMTRARRKLYVTASSDAEKLLGQAETDARFISSYSLSRSPSYIRWILASLKYAPDGILDGAYELLVNPGLENARIEVGAAVSEEEKSCPDDPGELKKELESRFAFEYPWSRLSRVPAKLSVSRLAPDILDDSPSDAAELEKPREITLSTPSFMLGETKASAAQRGTATHIFMQFCDFASVERLGVARELARLEADGFLDGYTASLVYPELVERFFGSELYREMRAAGKLWRETRFNLNLPAASFTTDGELKKTLEDESMLVQGVIDCFFERNGTLTLVDYKTDYLTKDEREHPEIAREKLLARHSAQLSYYRAALEKISGKRVSRTVVFSFWLGEAIEVPPENAVI